MAFSEKDIIRINEIFDSPEVSGGDHNAALNSLSQVRTILNRHLEQEAPYDSDTMHISYEVLSMLAENYFKRGEYALADEYYSLALYFVSLIGESSESRNGVEEVFKRAVLARTHQMKDDCEDLIRYASSSIDLKTAKKLIKETKKEAKKKGK